MQNKIEMYTHCKKCLKTLPMGVSPSEWSRLECGFTEDGFQVWCMRCNISVVYMEIQNLDEAEHVEVPFREELN